MKKKYFLHPLYVDGRCQTPKVLDFGITPSLVFAQANPEKVGDLGSAYAIAIKFGYWAFGVTLFIVKVRK